MKTIRMNVFETNSSSTHSMVIGTKDQFDKWEHGELFVDWHDNFVDKETAEERYHSYVEKYGEISFEDWCVDELYTYDRWFDNEYLEYESEDYTTPSGELIHMEFKYGSEY